MKNLREIITEYNNEVQFPFLNETIVVPCERNIYNQIRLKYTETADKAQVIFSSKLENYPDVQDLIDNIENDFLESISEGINELTRDAISVDCYTLDKNAAINLCKSKGYFDSFYSAKKLYEDSCNSIVNKYVKQIENVCSSSSNHRELKVATIGGGIGSVVANQLKADIFNSIVDGVYEKAAEVRVKNLIDQALRDLESFFEKRTHFDKLLQSAWNSAFNIQLVILNHLNEEYSLNLGGWITDDESTKAKSVHNNLTTLDLSDEKEKAFAMMILQLNPYNSSYYRTILSKYLDNAKEITAISDFYHVDLSEIYAEVIDAFAQKQIGDTFNDIKNCRSIVKSKIAETGFPESSIVLAEKSIQEHSAAKISSYLTDNMSDTRESTFECYNEAILIAKDISLNDEYTEQAFQPYKEKIEILDNQLLEELANWIRNNIGTTEDEAHKCREELTALIEKNRLDIDKTPILYDAIDKRLEKLDKEYRTVEGFTFPTRETADETKRIISENSDILYFKKENLTFRKDYLRFIREIRNLPLIEKMKNHFINTYQENLSEFDKKCANAKLYIEKKSGKKRTFKSFARSLFVSDDKLYKDWEEVTHNGQYSIDAVTESEE